jgi:CheY-like chemotaxis protein
MGRGTSVNGLATRTVLIVEDEWLVRMELVTAFEDEHFLVLESGSAEDALAILHDHAAERPRIDLLVTDIRLSGEISGWDLATHARTIDAGLAVIYVSANPPAPGRDVDGSVFIDKPALVGRVIDSARRLLIDED